MLPTTDIYKAVSQRFVDVLKTRGFSGWITYPVTVTGKYGEPVPGYHGLGITGRCGVLDSSKSMRILKRYPAGVFPAYRGYYFEPSTWDGSDLFTPPNGAYIFVTEAVKDALSELKIDNIIFTPLDQVEYSLP